MPERLIGIDAGGTMTKAALFDTQGVELACERRPNQMIFSGPGRTERDADGMWMAACDAIQALLESSGTKPGEIAGISCTGYGSGLYVVDRAGNPLRPGIVSTDSRAGALIGRWEQAGLARRNAPRVHQRLWAGQSITLMAWLAEHEPELVARAHSVTFCKDFLRGRLCGDHSTDPSDAGIAGLIDVTRRDYAEEAFEELGLGAWIGKVPPIAPGEAVAGKVTEEAARLTGLLAGTPVVRGYVDVTASSIASGVVSPEQMSIVAGTFSIDQTLHTSPRTSRLPVLQAPYPVEGYYLASEASPTSASNLEWFCKTLLPGAAQRAAAEGRSLYDLVNAAVAEALDRPNDILFFSYLFGWPADVPAGLIGLKAGHDFGDVMRGIYEGIVFAHRLDIDALLEGPDAARPTSIRLAGGASRSDVWAQIFADALGLPVEITDGSELGAQGVALCSAVALGLQPDIQSAVKSMVRVARRFEPRPERTAALDAKYRRYRQVAAALRAGWDGEEA